MSDTAYPVPSSFAAKSNLSPDSYRKTYARSIKDPAGFWGEQAGRLNWVKAPKQIKDCLLYTSPSPRDRTRSRMPSSA